MRKAIIPFILLVSGFFTACQSDGKNGGGSGGNDNRTLPGSNGGPLDVIVIAENAVWNGVAGDAFRKYFTAAQYGIPAPEPRYDVRHITPNDFGSLLKRSRNIFRLKVEPKDSLRSYLEEDKWARPQLVFNLAAQTDKKLAKIIIKRQKELRATVRKLEVENIQERLSGSLQKESFETLEKNALALEIPKTFEPGVVKEDVMVLWNKTQTYDMGLIVHVYPLTDDMSILGSNLVPIRDSITKKYVPASREGSYMKTETLIKPEIHPTELSGRFALEARGLWRAEGDMMGGSFINYSVFDEKNERVIFLDAFIYAPDLKKRNYLLQLEAILKSIQIKR